MSLASSVAGEEYDVLPLFSERYVLIASEQASLPHQLSWPEVADLPLCLLSRDMQNRQTLEELCDLDIARITSRNLVGGQSNVDAGTNVQVGARREIINNIGVYAQEQLQLLDTRLTVTLGLRGDQSSLNGDAKKMYIFPKAAAS